MKRTLLSAFACAAIAATGMATTVGHYDGYFRVQSASGVSDNNQYVQLTGLFTARPDQTYDEAKTEGGSVMYIKTADATIDPTDGKPVFELLSLRSQGVEVVGGIDEKYYQTLMDIVASETGTSAADLLYAMARHGRDNGYISLMRTVLESVIYVVAGRLESENSPAVELAGFAEAFNSEVANKINLHFYLKPDDNGNVMLYYDMFNLNSVSDWYLQDDYHKTTFEKGFENMRHFMRGKLNGMTGEGFEPYEVKMMQEWGYDITTKYADTFTGEIYYTPYEKIFADPDLLYNWLKLNMVKFMDVDMCPDITLSGFRLKSFAEEIQKHNLSKKLASYFKRLHTDTRYFLINGTVTDGTLAEGTAGDVYTYTGDFGFANLRETGIAGDAAKWRVIPVDTKDCAFGIEPQAYEVDDDTYYSAHIFDFPVKAFSKGMKLYSVVDDTKTATLTGTQSGKQYELDYVEVMEVQSVDRQTPFLVLSKGKSSKDFASHMLEVNYTTVMPETIDGFAVSDETVDRQYAPAYAGETAQGTSTAFKGVLLDTPLNSTMMHRMWLHDYDEEKNPIYRLDTNKSAVKKSVIFRKTTGTLNANDAFLHTSIPHPHDIVTIETPVLDEVPDIASGINGIEADSNAVNNVLYDLQGRPVSEPVSGQIYVLNGRKILVR